MKGFTHNCFTDTPPAHADNAIQPKLFARYRLHSKHPASGKKIDETTQTQTSICAARLRKPHSRPFENRQLFVPQ
jgi:hypothetical protein